MPKKFNFFRGYSQEESTLNEYVGITASTQTYPINNQDDYHRELNRQLSSREFFVPIRVTKKKRSFIDRFKSWWTNFKLSLPIILMVFLTSCNPELYVVGAGMRHHNLSQNKYQKNKMRKPIRVGSSPNSPFWILIRNR